MDANNKRISLLLCNKRAGWKKLFDEKVLKSPTVTQHRSTISAFGCGHFYRAAWLLLERQLNTYKASSEHH